MDNKNLSAFLDSNIGDSRHFKWKEALYLPSWDINVLPGEDIAINIIETAKSMENIRNIMGRPVNVTSWYRPDLYNEQIGGAKRSKHRDGLACDFYVVGWKSDDVREVLKEKLVRLNIRMENNPGSNWVHIDLGKPINNRYFKP